MVKCRWNRASLSRLSRRRLATCAFASLKAGAVAAWSVELGLDMLVNRRGTTWRKLADNQKARLDTEPTQLLLETPTLLKRPVIDLGDRRLVGFEASVILTLEAL